MEDVVRLYNVCKSVPFGASVAGTEAVWPRLVPARDTSEPGVAASRARRFVYLVSRLSRELPGREVERRRKCRSGAAAASLAAATQCLKNLC